MPEWLWRLWARPRYGPMCGVLPPWRLIDAKPCCIRSRGPHEWHADGQGFIWNQNQWRWMGPVVDHLRQEYDYITDGDGVPTRVFIEEGQRLASQRDDLIARGVDPNDLEIPL